MQSRQGNRILVRMVKIDGPLETKNKYLRQDLQSLKLFGCKYGFYFVWTMESIGAGLQKFKKRLLRVGVPENDHSSYYLENSRCDANSHQLMTHENSVALTHNDAFLCFPGTSSFKPFLFPEGRVYHFWIQKFCRRYRVWQVSIRISLEKRNASVATVALIRTGLGGWAGNEALEYKIATEYSELFFGLYQVSKNTFQFVDLFSLHLKC